MDHQQENNSQWTYEAPQQFTPEPKKEPLPLREQLKQVIKKHKQNQHPGRAAKAAGLEL